MCPYYLYYLVGLSNKDNKDTYFVVFDGFISILLLYFCYRSCQEESKRMAWLGHVMRMEGKRIPKRVLEWKQAGRRNRGRPRKRWIEDIEEDIQIMGMRGWRKLCKERAEWKKITEKAKTHSGL